MNKQTKEGLFSNQDLWVLILPLMIEQFLAISVGMADTMMVSHAGEAAVSGVSLVDMVNNVIIALLAALATGGAVIISQCIGAGRGEDATKAAGQLELLAFVVAGAIAVVSIVLAHPLIGLLFGNIDEEVFAACKTYLIITAISFPLLAIYNSGAAIFRSMGDSKTSMQVSVLMNVINIGGNGICVFGLGMGVEGVAIPSVISRGVAAVLITWLAARDKTRVHLNIQQVLHLDRSYMGRILYIGIPSGIENSLFQMGRVAVVSIIAGFGRVEIAANAIANNLDGLGITMGNAFGIAMITVVGRCVGAGAYDQSRHYAKKLLGWSYLSIILPAVFIILLQERFFALYQVSDATKELASALVTIHMGMAMFLWPISFVLPNALRAGADVGFTMGISLFSMAFFRLGISLVIAHTLQIGALGVWWAMVADWVFRASCFGLRFLSGKWYHRNTLVQKEERE